MTTNFLPFVYGLASALSWGAGDFSGGVASKRSNTFLVVLISQAIGGILLAGLALLFSEQLISEQDLLYGAIAGVSGMVGLLGLYAGLASGRMSVIAPLTAVISVILPVIITTFTDGLPATTILIGFGIAIVAVWFLSAGGGRQGQIQRQELQFAILAGIGFSLFFVFIDRVNDGAVFWPLVAARVVSVTLLTLFLLMRHRLHFRMHKGFSFSRSQLAIITLAGVFDTGGNAFFTLAAQSGRLDVAAVLASLYPASTVLLAWLFLKERLAQFQWVGVIAALVALVLIAI